MLCEDGGGEEFLHGLTVKGEIFPFAKNTAVLTFGSAEITDDAVSFGRRAIRPKGAVALC